MGYYIEVPAPTDKAGQLVSIHGAVPYAGEYEDIPADKLAVIVVQNGFFDAAAIIYSKREWEAFNEPGDRRASTSLLLDKAKVLELNPEVAREFPE